MSNKYLVWEGNDIKSKLNMETKRISFYDEYSAHIIR